MNKNKILGYALGPIGSALLGFISLPVITWFYSIEDVGKISMLQVVASLTVLLFCLGLDQAYVREYHDSTDKPKLFKTSFLPGFILLILAFSGLYLVDEMLISRWLYEQESHYLTIVSFACFILAFCSRFLSLILRMQERSFAYSMSQLLPKLFFLAFILSTVWLGLVKNFYNLITAHTLSMFIVFLVFSWNTRKQWVKSVTSTIDWNELKVLLHFGLPLVIGGLAAWGLNVMDKLFLRGLSTFSELGVYSVTVSVAGIATIFASIFNIIWAPLVYKWVNENKVDFKKIDDISEYLLASIYFIVVLSGLFSWVLPYFLPHEYAAIQYLISACLLGPLFYTLSEVTAVGIAIAKKTKYSMYVSTIAMGVNAIGNYMLIPTLGAAGAAISTAISFYFFYILRTEFSKKVWRKASYHRSYIIVTLLLLVSITNAIFYQLVFFYFYWIGLFFFGILFFREVLKKLHFNVLKLIKVRG
ncbi:oligosaccharide flippase family protein [Pseudoalteromonas rhizosphaerae]|uniref:oligosaccharide flippase family protein n=1 Tax=Pseudoalteromonas rhizosphaerae TaxID=2518973 RepID=UPI00384D6A99